LLSSLLQICFPRTLAVACAHVPEQQPISVVVADADPLAGALLAAVLNEQSDFAVSGAPDNQDSLLRSVRRAKPDVALISLDLGDGPKSGLAALPALHEADPQLRMVLLLNRPEPNLVVRAVRSGARGIFLRSEFEPAVLFKCVHRVHEGQFWLNTGEWEAVLAAWGRMPQLYLIDAQGARLLTNREEAVVQLAVEGLSNREIAPRLDLSEHTVKNHLFHIFDKLGVSSRVELVLYAVTNHENTPPITATDEVSAPA
jgi:DNA-binding NarL/FixJ family response regulator